MSIPITELEQAINFWRTRRPSQGEEHTLSAEVAALAAPYALLIFTGRSAIEPAELSEPAWAAYEAWRREAA